MATVLDSDIANTLTQEELDAINAEDSPEEQLIMRQAPEGESDDDDQDDADADTDSKVDDTPPASAKPTPAADPAQPVEPDADGEAPARKPSRYTAELPTDYDDQIKGLADRDAELRAKFKEGEIDIDERDQGLSEITTQRESLLVARTKHEVSNEMEQQRAFNEWQSTVDSFIKSAAKEDGGIDYRKNEAQAKEFDKMVKYLANDPDNASQSADWFLAEAHKIVKARAGITTAPASTAPAAKVDPIAAARAARKSPLDAAPKTLAQVPGSDGPGDLDDEFSDLDSLDGLDLEDAIARMTPAKREKYLAGN